MAGKNPNISLSFTASKFQTEIKGMTDSLKTVKKEFEVSNLAIQANGNALDLSANKIAGYAKQAEAQRAITNKVREAVEAATKAHADAGSRVETAKQAYDKAARSESTSKDELQKLKKELDNANNTYDRLGKAVGTWNNKLLDSQKAENQLTLATKQANTEIANQKKGLEQNAKSAQNVTTSTGQLYNAFAMLKAIAVGYAGKSLYEALIGSNAQFEQYMTSFEVLLGGIDKADKRMKELTQFAAVTPFELPQLVEAERRLLAYGVAVKDTAKVLPMLGDISMGNADKLDKISLAYGQVVTNARLYGTELRQFAENGVPLLAELAKMYGVTEAEMRKMVTDGQIGTEAVTAALESMTSAGGKFFGMMDKQSQTMTGMWSTMKDNFGIFAREVGENSFNYLKGSLGDITDEITRMSQSGELGDIAADWGRGIADFVSFSADAIMTLWDMKEALLAAGAGVVAFKTTMAISATVTSVANAIETYTTAVKAGTTATAAMTAVMKVNPWVLLASAIAAVITAIVAYNVITNDTVNETDELVEKTKELTEEYERNIKSADRQSNSQLGEAEVARRLTGELDELNKKVNKTTEDKTRMANIVDQLNTKIPNLALAINSETGELNKQIGVVYDAIGAYKELLFVKAGESRATAAAGSLLDLNDQKAELEKELSNLTKQQTDLKNQKPTNSYQRDYNAFINVTDISPQIKNVKESIAEVEKAIADADKQIQDSFNMSKEYSEKYGDTPTTEPYTPPPLITDPNDSSAETARQKAIKKVFDDLKYTFDMGYITEAEYYEKLEALRDKYYKKGSDEWQNYTLQLKQYDEKLYSDRRANSDQWIAEQKYYGKLTSDEEIAAYERIRVYTEEYYKNGVIDYEEYRKQIKDIDKNVFEVRKSLIEKTIDTEVEAEKTKLDARKEALAEEQDAIKDSYDERKQAIEDYYDEIEQTEKRQDRAAKLSDLLKEEAKYQLAATKEGKERLQKIRDEIAGINQETAKELRDTEKKKKLSEAEAERDRLEEDRLRRMEVLNEDYKNLDTAQKTLLSNISTYAAISAGAIELVTKKIRDWVQVLSGLKVTNTKSTTSTGGVTTGANFTVNDYGDKNFNTNGEAIDYTKELANSIEDAARVIGGNI